ncbi:MAG: translation initiation factor IF-2 N-terminal domain-containing protein, partial [Planctomycetota bacterium]
MASTRVYILAKELGIKSSAIVKKCQDEGLDVKNHMSVLKAGLAATIREWFSEGENITTVETSEKVDLAKVRIKRKKKTPKPEEEKPKVKKLKPAAERTKAVAETAVATEIAAAPEQIEITDKEDVTEAAVEKETAVTTIEEPPPDEVKIIEAPPEPPPEPEPIVPAGPMLEKPEPAKLSGPQVVRVEAPEPVRRRSKPKPKARYDAPVTEPLMYSQKEREEPPSSTGKDKKSSSKRQKERTHGRRREGRESETVKKPKTGSRWRQRDIEERQARLEAAGGEGLRLRPTRRIASKSKQKASAPVRPQKVV